MTDLVLSSGGTTLRLYGNIQTATGERCAVDMQGDRRPRLPRLNERNGFAAGATGRKGHVEDDRRARPIAAAMSRDMVVTESLDGGSSGVESVDMGATDVVDSLEPLGRLLWELGPGQCLYAISEIEPRQHRFCAAPASEIGGAWCAQHRSIVYAAVPAHSASEKAAELQRRSRRAIRAEME